ncbi:CidA/LrgA family protein [Alteromonas sp. ASW11-36]|uniref:CidA/LrgA family protein n=1 Tax=Alteromonas arenosi TaxID=3055817 RepID=A0ABT7T0L6_9ALTE|nr:CidA/LrgA family protein [Alteromonas sp. ASW11-36]MDM7861930.1 CidA/LrgA family protein [Alteromonas sp. ASW11-36]
MVNDAIRLLAAGVAIVTCLLAGAWLSTLLPVRLPAAILGLLLLLFCLCVCGKVPNALQRTARPLLVHMPLFFVPAVIAVWQFTDVIKTNGLTLFVAIVVSTLVVGVALAAWVNTLLKDKHEH